MTPIPNPASDAERFYNVKHAEARKQVERAASLVKSRFRGISDKRKQRYDPVKAAKIIHSCMVLHNFLISQNFDVTNIREVRRVHYRQHIHKNRNGEFLREGRRIRSELAEDLFQNYQPLP